MDFVDEENIAGLEVGEDADEIGGADGGAGGNLRGGAGHFIGDDVGEGGFAEAWRAGEEDVLHGFGAFFGGFDGDADAFDEFGLADVFVEFARTEAGLCSSQPGRCPRVVHFRRRCAGCGLHASGFEAEDGGDDFLGVFEVWGRCRRRV